MSALNWQNLRVWNGSQRSAFEELCCQLAAHGPAIGDGIYRRIGAPDAGVECTWTNKQRQVRGWQAKFFLRPLKSGKWKQIDESVEQALHHYPELIERTRGSHLGSKRCRQSVLHSGAMQPTSIFR